MLITGGCHCRNIAFTVACEPDPTTILARRCTCCFCTKHGAVWTSISSASLRVSINEPALLTRYVFDTCTAQFHICTQCGVVPLATSEIEDRLYAIVNARAFDDFDDSLLHYASANFDGESENRRLLRRKQNWIANVEYVESDIKRSRMAPN